uniref:CCHC-type domain-containing protein n=1 Tax=Fagus sylvatica TaxID=28930 RepID=A0A2N9GLU6_FAGSY
MDSLEEDLALLTESANRLVCKEGSFSLKASSEATVKVENLILVEKIVAERVINKNKVAVITQKAWKPTKGMSVKMVGENLFLFTFNEAGDKRRVEVQAPWNIDGFHLILKRVKRNKLPREVDFSTTFFWVQAHNLPLEYLSKENAEIIGNGMGKYIEVDLSRTESSKGGNFLRFKVEIKLSAPLLKGFWLERTQLSDLWVQLKYERLPDFCYLCGRLGHMKKECTKSGAREEGDGALDRNLKKFGPWLVAETVERKMHRASDLMFMDVIDEYSTEKQGGTSHSRIVVEGGASASELHAVDERVEEMVSLSEADVHLKKVSAARDKVGRKIIASNSDNDSAMEFSEKAEEASPNLPPPSPMSLLSWNCRRLAQPAAVRSLRAMVRLILGWKAEVDIEVTVANKNIINAIVFSSPPNQPWMLTVVYAPPSKSHRTLFWDHLKKLSDSFPGPWICVGDFNCIKEQSEKAGGKPFASSSNSELGGFLFDCNLIDLRFYGNSFTWSNKRKGQANIKDRLDRAVTNVGWRSLFPRASVRHLPATSSDHNPILVNTMGEASSGPKPFKFKQAWTRDGSCAEVIREAWAKPAFGSPQAILIQKQTKTKVRLKWWNKNIFGTIQKRIEELGKAIDDIQAKEPTMANYLNTKFFQVSTIVRRKRNQINLLKKADGNWTQDQAEIGMCFTDFFSNLFNSSNPPFPDEISKLFHPIINDEDNTAICSVPNEEKIKDSLFSMESLKSPGPDGLPPLFYKHYWSIVKKDASSPVSGTLHSGKLNGNLLKMPVPGKTEFRTIPLLLKKYQDHLGSPHGMISPSRGLKAGRFHSPLLVHSLAQRHLIIFASANRVGAKAIHYAMFVQIPILVWSKACNCYGEENLRELFAIGRGLEAWDNSWIPSLEGFKPSPKSQEARHPLWVSELIINNPPRWDLDKLKNFFDDNTIRAIQEIHLSQIPQQNKMCWAPSSSGKFTAKSAYWLDQKPRFENNGPLTSVEWKSLWKLKIHDRLKLMLWKMAWGMLPTMVALNVRFRVNSTQCQLCNSGVETLEHLFIECPFARIAWYLSPWPFRFNVISPLSISEWIKLILNPADLLGCPKEKERHLTLFAAICCDMIWMKRNEATRKPEKVEPAKLAAQTKLNYTNHFQAREFQAQTRFQFSG